VAYLECAKGRGPKGLGDGSPPVGSRGKAPVGGLGDEVFVPRNLRPPKAEAFLLMNA